MLNTIKSMSPWTTLLLTGIALTGFMSCGKEPSTKSGDTATHSPATPVTPLPEPPGSQGNAPQNGSRDVQPGSGGNHPPSPPSAQDSNSKAKCLAEGLGPWLLERRLAELASRSGVAALKCSATAEEATQVIQSRP